MNEQFLWAVLPCARITSIRVKGTFSALVCENLSTPSGLVVKQVLQLCPAHGAAYSNPQEAV